MRDIDKETAKKFVEMLFEKGFPPKMISSYFEVIRNNQEIYNVINYIENNPESSKDDINNYIMLSYLESRDIIIQDSEEE